MTKYITPLKIEGAVLAYHRRTIKILSPNAAQLIGVCNATYSKYERGITSMPFNDLRKFCDHLGITLVVYVQHVQRVEKYLNAATARVRDDFSDDPYGESLDQATLLKAVKKTAPIKSKPDVQRKSEPHVRHVY